MLHKPLLTFVMGALLVALPAVAVDFCPSKSDSMSTGGGTRPNDTACGDIDGDGLIDIITVNDSTDNVSILLSIDGVTFASAVRIDVGDEPVALVVVDIDNDGDLDILTANHTSNDVTLLRNNGLVPFPKRYYDFFRFAC